MEFVDAEVFIQEIKGETTMSYQYEDNLESGRLITRFITLDDVPAWSEFFKDKEAIEYFPVMDLPDDEARARHWIERQLMRYANHKYGLQVLIEKKTNRFVGLCGLITQDLDGKEELEVGYHVFRKYWGQGFAPEAAKLFFDYAFNNNLSATVISIIHKDNIRSQRVAEKNGLKRDSETTWNNLEVFIYRVRKEDWKF